MTKWQNIFSNYVTFFSSHVSLHTLSTHSLHTPPLTHLTDTFLLTFSHNLTHTSYSHFLLTHSHPFTHNFHSPHTTLTIRRREFSTLGGIILHVKHHFPSFTFIISITNTFSTILHNNFQPPLTIFNYYLI